jgi:hypothetical protein
MNCAACAIPEQLIFSNEKVTGRKSSSENVSIASHAFSNGFSILLQVSPIDVIYHEGATLLKGYLLPRLQLDRGLAQADSGEGHFCDSKSGLRKDECRAHNGV